MQHNEGQTIEGTVYITPWPTTDINKMPDGHTTVVLVAQVDGKFYYVGSDAPLGPDVKVAELVQGMPCLVSTGGSWEPAIFDGRTTGWRQPNMHGIEGRDELVRYDLVAYPNELFADVTLAKDKFGWDDPLPSDLTHWAKQLAARYMGSTPVGGEELLFELTHATPYTELEAVISKLGESSIYWRGESTRLRNNAESARGALVDLLGMVKRELDDHEEYAEDMCASGKAELRDMFETWGVTPPDCLSPDLSEVTAAIENVRDEVDSNIYEMRRVRDLLNDAFASSERGDGDGAYREFDDARSHYSSYISEPDFAEAEGRFEDAGVS